VVGLAVVWADRIVVFGHREALSSQYRSSVALVGCWRELCFAIGTLVASVARAECCMPAVVGREGSFVSQLDRRRRDSLVEAVRVDRRAVLLLV
jgi:hypothetical protein